MAKLLPGHRREECLDCGKTWIANGPDKKDPCPICQSSNVRIHRGESKKKRSTGTVSS